jgi:hypothetical protein
VRFHGSAGTRAGHLESRYAVLNTLSKSCPVCTHCRGQLSSETALYRSDKLVCGTNTDKALEAILDSQATA